MFGCTSYLSALLLNSGLSRSSGGAADGTTFTGGEDLAGKCLGRLSALCTLVRKSYRHIVRGCAIAIVR